MASNVVIGIGVWLVLLSAASGCARASPHSDCDDRALIARGETNYRIDYGTAASDCLSTQALALPDHTDLHYFGETTFNYADSTVNMDSNGDACGMELHMLVTAITTKRKTRVSHGPDRRATRRYLSCVSARDSDARGRHAMHHHDPDRTEHDRSGRWLAA
jgi:hypothetical protein